MMRERILNVLYDLAITISGESHLQPLLTRTLQQLMQHTDSPCGIILLTDKAPGTEKTSLLLVKAIGDAIAQVSTGMVVRLESRRLAGEGSATFDASLLENIPCQKDRYRRMLSLPIPGMGMILLLSPGNAPIDLPVETMFTPILANLAKSIYLCHTNDARNEELEMQVRQRTEAQQRSEQEFRSIFDNIRDTFYRADTEGRILMLSPSVKELVGGTSEEVVGHRLTDFYVDPGERELFLKEMRDNNGEVRHHEVRIRRLDGRQIWVSTNSRYFFNERDEVAGVEGIIRDITDQKELEEQLQQAQKMEAIGRLVGGIAHDFNNILAAIQGNVFLAGMDMRDGKPALEELGNIDKLSQRAAEMIRQLLAFSRKDTVKMQPLELNSFIRETFALTRSMIPENIDIEVLLPEQKLHINGDQTQLQQILINLINNAQDAVDSRDDALITVRLDTARPDEPLLQRFPGIDPEAEMAHFTVRDNGYGIPESQLDKIFEPFFTTKEVDRGTGLGLSMVYGAMQTHGGGIRVDSTPGEGTAFHLYLPLYKGEEIEAEKADDDIVHGHGETVLLVDDDRDVRRSVRILLDTLGYDVIEAGNGKEALDIYRDHIERIDLLLTDIVMPGMKGTDAAESMHRLNHQLPVIFMTGYDEDHVVDEVNRPEESLLLTKPFQISELSQSIHTLLHRRDHPPGATPLPKAGKSA